MAEYQLKRTTGRLVPERKCITKNDRKFYKKHEILDFLKLIQNQKIYEKSMIFDQKVMFFKQILNMVRSTLLHLHPSAGLRLILGVPALVHDFDTLTFQPFIDIFNISRKPQTKLQNYIRALIWLNISSNGQQEDSL